MSPDTAISTETETLKRFCNLFGVEPVDMWTRDILNSEVEGRYNPNFLSNSNPQDELDDLSVKVNRFIRSNPDSVEIQHLMSTLDLLLKQQNSSHQQFVVHHLLSTYT